VVGVLRLMSMRWSNREQYIWPLYITGFEAVGYRGGNRFPNGHVTTVRVLLSPPLYTIIATRSSFLHITTGTFWSGQGFARAVHGDGDGDRSQRKQRGWDVISSFILVDVSQLIGWRQIISMKHHSNVGKRSKYKINHFTVEDGNEPASQMHIFSFLFLESFDIIVVGMALHIMHKFNCGTYIDHS